MPKLYKLLQNSLVEKIFLVVLASAYMVYLIGFAHVLSPFVPGPVAGIVEDQINADPASELQYWTPTNMSTALTADEQLGNVPDFSQTSDNPNAGTPAKQEGQAPQNNNLSFPLSTVGKIFFSDSAGLNYVCSGTAIVSQNKNTVDTAGHCLYGPRKWSQNVIFCPLYDHGPGSYGCWAARTLEVPAEWINAKPNELHRDYGMIIVAPNSQGNLTDAVGGAGWAYNQPIKQPFYAYGYPAGSPFDGQSRKACDKGSVGTSWQHAGGTVISIPCDMTGGSSGGGWFIKSGNSWYLNGHNDFISTIQRGHMFSPYYDDVWYTLYSKAQNA